MGGSSTRRITCLRVFRAPHAATAPQWRIEFFPRGRGGGSVAKRRNRSEEVSPPWFHPPDAPAFPHPPPQPRRRPPGAAGRPRRPGRRGGAARQRGHQLHPHQLLGHKPRRPRLPGRQPDQPVPRRQRPLPAGQLLQPHRLLRLEVAAHGRLRLLRPRRPRPPDRPRRLPTRQRLRLQRQQLGREHRLGLPQRPSRRQRLARLPRPQSQHRKRQPTRPPASASPPTPTASSTGPKASATTPPTTPPPAPTPPPPTGSDTQKPTAPTGLAVVSATQTSAQLRWNAAGDNVGVTGYGIYVGSTLIGSVSGTSVSVSGFQCGRSYAVGVDARDAAGNRSGIVTITVATTACSGGGGETPSHRRHHRAWPRRRSRAAPSPSAGAPPPTMSV